MSIKFSDLLKKHYKVKTHKALSKKMSEYGKVNFDLCMLGHVQDLELTEFLPNMTFIANSIKDRLVMYGSPDYASDYISDNNEEYSDNMIINTIKNKLLNGQNVNDRILTKISVMCNELENRISELETEIEDDDDADDGILQQDMNDFMEQLQLFQDFLKRNDNKHNKKRGKKN